MKKLVLIALILISCGKTAEVLKVKLPENTCRPSEIKLSFEPVLDLSSILRNQELASLYFYQQKEQKNSMITCYEDVIKEVNK